MPAMNARRSVGAALLALMLDACGGAPPAATHGSEPADSCAAFDGAIASVAALRREGRVDRAAKVATAAMKACPKRAQDMRADALGALLDVGRLDEARELAAEILGEGARASEPEQSLARRVPAEPSSSERAAPLVGTAGAEAMLEKGAPREALARADEIWSRQPWHGRAALVAGYAAAALGDGPGARLRFDRALVAYEASAHDRAAIVQVVGSAGTVAPAKLVPTHEEVTLLSQPIRAGDLAPLRAVGKVLFSGRGVNILEIGGAAEAFDDEGKSLGRLARFDRFEVLGDWIVASNNTSTVVFDRGLRERGRSGAPLMERSHLSTDEGARALLETTDTEVRVLELPSLKTTLAFEGVIAGQAFFQQRKLAVMSADAKRNGPPAVFVDVYDLDTKKRLARADIYGFGITFSWVPNFGMDPEGNRLGWSTDETVVLDLRTQKRVTLATNGELLGGDPYARSSGLGFTKDDKHVCFDQFARTRVVPPVPTPPGKTTHCLPVDGRAVIVHLPLTPGRERVLGSMGHLTRIFPEATSKDGKLVAVLDVDKASAPEEGSMAIGGHAHLGVFKVVGGARVADIDVGDLAPTAELQVRFVGEDAVGIATGDGGGTYRIATGERVGDRPRFEYEDDLEGSSKSLPPRAGEVRIGGPFVLATSEAPGDVGYAQWNLSTGRLVADGSEPPCFARISGGGRAIGVATCDRPGSGRGKVRVRVDGGAPSAPTEVPEGFAISDSGRLVFGEGKLRVADLGPAGWTTRDVDVPVSGTPRLSPDGAHALADFEGKVRLVSVNDRDVIAKFPTAHRQLVGFIDNRIFIADSHVRVVSGALPPGPLPVGLETRDSPTVVDVAGSSGGVERSLLLVAPTPTAWTMLPGALIALSDGLQVVRVFSLSDGSLRRAFVPTGRASALLFHPDGGATRLGPRGRRERLLCKIGGELLPLEVCEERLLSSGPPAPLAP